MTEEEILKEKFPNIKDLSNDAGKKIIEAMQDFASKQTEQNVIEAFRAGRKAGAAFKRASDNEG